MDRDAIDSEAS